MTIDPALNRSGFTSMSALLGVTIWLALLVGRLAGNESLGVIELMLLLAILVFVPLGLELAATPDKTGRNAVVYRLARFLQPIGAVMAAASFLTPIGFWSGMLASVWFGVSGLIAVYGVTRILSRRKIRIEEFCIDAALLYLPVGGAWLLATRVGFAPLGFGGVIALLTAVHFHYAGFIAPIIAGMTGRTLDPAREPAWGFYKIAGAGIVAGPPLVAMGITLSKEMEVVSAAVLAVCMSVHAGLLLVAVRPLLASPKARVLLGTAALSSVVAMFFACLYALGMYTERFFISIPQMALVHGCTNGLFALCGLLGWGIVRPSANERES